MSGRIDRSKRSTDWRGYSSTLGLAILVQGRVAELLGGAHAGDADVVIEVAQELCRMLVALLADFGVDPGDEVVGCAPSTTSPMLFLRGDGAAVERLTESPAVFEMEVIGGELDVREVQWGQAIRQIRMPFDRAARVLLRVDGAPRAPNDAERALALGWRSLPQPDQQRAVLALCAALGVSLPPELGEVPC